MKNFQEVLLLLLLLSTSCFLSSGDDACPPTDVMTPCTCKLVAYGINVVCANLVDPQVLSSTFRRLSEYHLDSLLLHGINFTRRVSQDFFSGMRIDSLHVERSRLIFEGSAFRGLENNLMQLKVMKCSEMGDLEIAELRMLQELYLTGNKRQKVSKTWLGTKTPKLRILNVDSNEITAIEEGAFAQLTRLKEISLADNRISVVARDMFPSPAPSLTRIDLSHNVLIDLPIDIFSRMPSLENVILSGNELRTLDATTWEEIWNQLRSVYLYENSIICDERIEWIKQRKKPHLFEGTCVEPEDMAGKSLREALFSA